MVDSNIVSGTRQPDRGAVAVLNFSLQGCDADPRIEILGILRSSSSLPAGLQVDQVRNPGFHFGALPTSRAAGLIASRRRSPCSDSRGILMMWALADDSPGVLASAV